MIAMHVACMSAAWARQVRELAILGFVSFTATVLMQFIKLHEEMKEFFEYSHVLLFLTAVFYGTLHTVCTLSAHCRLHLHPLHRTLPAARLRYPPR